MLSVYLALQLTLVGAGQGNHNWVGPLKNNGGGFWGPVCTTVIKGGVTCGQCALLTQRSKLECPGAESGCTPGCP